MRQGMAVGSPRLPRRLTMRVVEAAPYRPGEAMLRCWGELLTDAVSCAARAHRMREADRAPRPEFAEAWRWLFDPDWRPGHVVDATGRIVARSLSFEQVAAGLGAEPSALRRTLHARVRTLAGARYTKRRATYAGEPRYNQRGPLRLRATSASLG